MPTPLLDREQFQEQQRRSTEHKLKWIDDSDAQCRFHHLAMATYDALSAIGAKFILPFDPSPKSAGNALNTAWSNDRQGHTRLTLPSDLARRWREWNIEYFVIRARSPKLELRDLMQDISESHDASSWPAGYERKIQDWVDAGDPNAPPPFDDRHGIATEKFLQRLKVLRQKLTGWMFWDDPSGSVRFAPEAEWQRFKAEQEATTLKMQGDWETSITLFERLAKRLPEILALARADEKFWSQLQAWETDRESKRPERQGATAGVSQLSGPIAIRSVNRKEQEKIENPAMDSIWVQFYDRVHQPDDGLNRLVFVVTLRAEIRRELGYDTVFSWTGGPGIGEG